MNAFTLFLYVTFAVIFGAACWGAGYSSREREERKRREDWTPSDVRFRNVVNMKNYQALTRTRRHWMA